VLSPDNEPRALSVDMLSEIISYIKQSQPTHSRPWSRWGDPGHVQSTVPSNRRLAPIQLRLLPPQLRTPPPRPTSSVLSTRPSRTQQLVDTIEWRIYDHYNEPI
jgi:hypothetical protein